MPVSASPTCSSSSSARTPRGPAVEVVQPGEQHEVLPGSEDVVDRRLLPDQADPPPDRPRVPDDVDPGHLHPSAVRPGQRRQDAHRRRLARAVRARAGRRPTPRATCRSTPSSTTFSPYLLVSPATEIALGHGYLRTLYVSWSGRSTYAVRRYPPAAQACGRVRTWPPSSRAPATRRAAWRCSGDAVADGGRPAGPEAVAGRRPDRRRRPSRLADAEGLAAVSMRRVAAELGVAAMTLYSARARARASSST